MDNENSRVMGYRTLLITTAIYAPFYFLLMTQYHFFLLSAAFVLFDYIKRAVLFKFVAHKKKLTVWVMGSVIYASMLCAFMKYSQCAPGTQVELCKVSAYLLAGGYFLSWMVLYICLAFSAKKSLIEK